MSWVSRWLCPRESVLVSEGGVVLDLLRGMVMGKDLVSSGCKVDLNLGGEGFAKKVVTSSVNSSCDCCHLWVPVNTIFRPDLVFPINLNLNFLYVNTLPLQGSATPNVQMGGWSHNL